jgi:hypothetical protein
VRSNSDLTSLRKVRRRVCAVLTLVHHAALQFKATKWTTLTWTDFLSSGFSRASSPLNAMLQIDPGAAGRCHPQGEEDVEAPPTVRIGHRACHGHGGDYRGSIIDVFCDFVYGVGWIDICRGDVDNRALVSASVGKIRDRRFDVFSQVEFKSLRLSRSRCRPAHFLHRITCRRFFGSNTTSNALLVRPVRLYSHLVSQRSRSKP